MTAAAAVQFSQGDVQAWCRIVVPPVADAIVADQTRARLTHGSHVVQVCVFVCLSVCLSPLPCLSLSHTSLSFNLSLRDPVHFQRSFQRLHPKMRGTRWGRRVLVVFDVPGKCMLLFRVLVLSCSLPYACAAVHVAAARCGGRLCNDAPARGNARAQLPSRCHRTHA